jgi:nucleoside-diphosphate-sugar epimerase
MQIHTISILGCGWLGISLAEQLREAGYVVKGSTTKPAKLELLAQKGILPYLVQLEGGLLNKADADFFNTDLCIISLTPSGAGQEKDTYVEAMHAIKERLKPGCGVIMISSTSIYPDLNRVVTEDDVRQAQDAGNKSIAAAEDVWRQALQEGTLQTTIVRCAGLMGYNRMPGRYFAGKTGLPGANTPVNLIHRDDVTAILLQIIQNGKWGEVLNLVADEHPAKRDLYIKNAKEFGFAEPGFDEAHANPAYKTVSNARLKKITGYSFKYPSPLYFKYDQ